MATVLVRTPQTPKSVTALLQAVQNGPGVLGAFVADYRGTTLAGVGAYFSVGQEWSTYDRISVCITQMAAVCQARSGQWKELEIRFTRVLFVVRDLGHALLVALCAPDVNPSLLRMSLNVATGPIEKDVPAQKALGAGIPSRLETLGEKYLSDTAWQLIRKTGLVNGPAGPGKERNAW